MLAKLKFLPPDPQAANADERLSDSVEPMPLELDADNEQSDAAHIALSTARFAPTNETASEGGMVGLVRDKLSDRSAIMEPGLLANSESLLDSPVRMDSAYGKFQVFEISTADELPRPPAPSPADGAKVDLPAYFPADELRIAAIDALHESSAIAKHDHPAAAPEETWLLDEPAIAEVVSATPRLPSPAAPESGESWTSLSLGEIAAGLAVALATCAARMPRISEVDERDRLWPARQFAPGAGQSR
jgi:hypothetical protein